MLLTPMVRVVAFQGRGARADGSGFVSLMWMHEEWGLVWQSWRRVGTIVKHGMVTVYIRILLGWFVEINDVLEL